jgi:hypothetical protein
MPRTFAPTNCWLCHKTRNSTSGWAAPLVLEKYPLNTAKEELVIFLYDGNGNFNAKDNIKNENEKKEVNVPVLLVRSSSRGIDNIADCVPFPWNASYR